MKHSSLLKVALSTTLTLSACASLFHRTPPPKQQANASTAESKAPVSNEPKLITDLSQLAPDEPGKAEGEKPVNAADLEVLEKQKKPPRAPGQSNVARIFGGTPGTAVGYGGRHSPGSERLLNPKALEFAPFTRRLLHQVFIATQELESKDLGLRGVPPDLRPVVITAILDKNGKLSELVVDQDSGDARVDKMMVKACRRGLWVNNPPPQAADSDGNYKLRIETRIVKYVRPEDTNLWTFKTDMGLALE